MHDRHATIAANIRALSNMSQLPVHISHDFMPVPFAGNPSDRIALQKTAEINALRSHGDYAAALLRYSDNTVDLGYHAYAHDLEAIRTLFCLMDDYPGTKHHVDGFLPHISSDPKFIFLWALWANVTGEDRPELIPELNLDIDHNALKQSLRNAEAFHQLMRDLLTEMSKNEPNINAPQAPKEKPAQTMSEDAQDHEPQNNNEDHSGDHKASKPQEKQETTEQTQSQQGASEGDEDTTSTVLEENTSKKIDLDDDFETQYIQEPKRNDRLKQSKDVLSKTTQYDVFTSRYDQVVSASSLALLCDQISLRDNLDNALKNDGLSNSAVRLANRLQRLLMAQKRHQWRRNTDQGILDTHRLSRLVIDPSYPMAHKRRIMDHYDETIVSIVIDNSGSMRGRPMLLAALSADILTKTLERCGVASEVLGYTTKEWKGGQSYRDWILQGSPKSVGRLNDLRHIVYKSADQPYRRARHSMAVMLKDSILKENIDGEALLWAHDRLSKRPETRKIMIVISDGAPVDDATAVANNNDTSFLEKHLKTTAQWIETQTPVELIAIGIGHDVSAYYKNAFVLSSAEQLVETMMKQLTRLLV